MKRLVAFAVLALVAAAAAGAATPSPLRVTGFARIGAFHVHGGNLAKARVAFGRPTRTRDVRTRSCEVDWPGVHISFYTLARDRQCAADTPFGWAEITRPWVTERGLRQGDTLAKARRLYPAARKEKPSFAGAHGVGLIIRLSQAIGDYGLAAVAVNGRLTKLVISDPQGGE